jgi:hypothetical protein
MDPTKVAQMVEVLNELTPVRPLPVGRLYVDRPG